jgi:hypothetical protein
MKPRVYLETTIPSYLAARSSRDTVIAEHQQTTHGWHCPVICTPEQLLPKEETL